MDSKAMVDMRLRMATSNDKMLGMAFEGCLDHLSNTYGAAIVDPIRKKVVGDKVIRGFFWYPVSQLLDVVRQLLDHPGVTTSCDVLMRRCGERGFLSLLESPVGKMLTVLGKGNLQELTATGPYAYTLVARFGKREYSKTGERSAEVTFTNDLFGPAFTIGVYAAASKAVSSVEPTITATVLDEAGTSFVIRLSW